MNKGEILMTIHNMRGEYAHKQNEALMQTGKNTIERPLLGPLTASSLERSYYNAKAKVAVLDELLEKIDNTTVSIDPPGLGIEVTDNTSHMKCGEFKVTQEDCEYWRDL